MAPRFYDDITLQIHGELRSIATDLRHLTADIAEIRAALPKIEERLSALEAAKLKFAGAGAGAGGVVAALAWLINKIVG